MFLNPQNNKAFFLAKNRLRIQISVKIVGVFTISGMPPRVRASPMLLIGKAELIFFLHLGLVLLDELLLDVVRHELVARELGVERSTAASE